MMKKCILTAVIFMVAGFVAAMLIFIYQGPSMMMLEDQSRFDFDRTVAGQEDLARDQGWSVPPVHDLQKSMEKFGHKVKELKIFALCNPDHAINILQGDEEGVVIK
jgi:uncharacterized protein (DUF302 family)